MWPEYHTFIVGTPDGEFVVDCPTFQGRDAAARRVLFSFMAYGYEPEDIAIEYRP